MKESTKGFWSGVLAATLVLGMSATALAASGTVSFNSVNLRFNGQQISAKGEDYKLDSGVSVPASILYTDENGGGTTYLPIARISELMGTEIGWDGATGSVRIGEEPVNSLPVSEPDNTSTPDYSDWTEEQEKAYQEFKELWGEITISAEDKENTLFRTQYNGTGNYSNEELSAIIVEAKTDGRINRLVSELEYNTPKCAFHFVSEFGSILWLPIQ